MLQILCKWPFDSFFVFISLLNPIFSCSFPLKLLCCPRHSLCLSTLSFLRNMDFAHILSLSMRVRGMLRRFKIGHRTLTCLGMWASPLISLVQNRFATFVFQTIGILLGCWHLSCQTYLLMEFLGEIMLFFFDI